MNYLCFDKIKDINNGEIEVYCYDTGIKYLCIPAHHYTCMREKNTHGVIKWMCMNEQHHNLINNIYEWYISAHAIKLKILKITDEDLNNASLYEKQKNIEIKVSQRVIDQ